ncbi:MAG TPA: hypothetical protein GXX19_02595, partial [Syntrophomonadaceae bacterium]|nr:hypothetical protein [Syntrophomonadaceae bacterium]
GQAELASRLQNVEKGQAELASRLQNVEKGQQRIEARLESEVIEKIRALFDARQVQLDYFESLKDGQSRIEKSLNILRRRTAEHEFKLRAHDRELRLLRTEKK